jgi:hypothetical protein
MLGTAGRLVNRIFSPAQTAQQVSRYPDHPGFDPRELEQDPVRPLLYMLKWSFDARPDTVIRAEADHALCIEARFL